MEQNRRSSLSQARIASEPPLSPPIAYSLPIESSAAPKHERSICIDGSMYHRPAR